MIPSSTFGQQVTFTAFLSVTLPGGGLPTGTVTFSVPGQADQTVALGGGQASYVTDLLPAGTHTITGVYGGDTNFSGCTGTLTYTVAQAGTTMIITGTP